MTEPISIEQLKNASLDAQDLEAFVSDPNPKDVRTRLGGTYPNLAKITKRLIEQGLTNAQMFATHAEMIQSSAELDSHALVTDDPHIPNNGYYRKTGSGWQYLAYNPSSLVINAIDELNHQFKYSFVEKSIGTIPGIIAAITDKNGNQTWLQANDDDGGMTELAETEVRQRLGIEKIEMGIGTFALVDSDGNLTDLWLDNDGKISETVLKDWSDRLQKINGNTKSNQHIINIDHTLPALAAENVSIGTTDAYYKDGELLPVLPDCNKIVLIGSSSLDNSQNEVKRELLKISPELQFYNPCFGGAKMDQMEAMFGSTPLKLKFNEDTINAEGQSNATIANNVRFIQPRMSMFGWVDGIHGKLTSQSDGHSVIFERSKAGQPVQLNNDIDFIPELGNQYRNAIPIIWIGKNNLYDNNSDINDVDALMQATNKMIEYNASLVKRLVVITHFNNTNVSPSSEAHYRVRRCNHLMKLRYKSCVFDIEELILGTQIFTDLGLVRTQADIEQQALGNLPPSLSLDAGHLSSNVNQYFAEKLAQFIKEKNWDK